MRWLKEFRKLSVFVLSEVIPLVLRTIVRITKVSRYTVCDSKIDEAEEEKYRSIKCLMRWLPWNGWSKMTRAGGSLR